MNWPNPKLVGARPPNPAGGGHKNDIAGHHLDVVEEDHVTNANGQELLRFRLVDALDFGHQALAFSSCLLGCTGEEEHPEGILFAKKATNLASGKVCEKRPSFSSHLHFGRYAVERGEGITRMCTFAVQSKGGVLCLQRYVSPDFW